MYRAGPPRLGYVAPIGPRSATPPRPFARTTTAADKYGVEGARRRAARQQILKSMGLPTDLRDLDPETIRRLQRGGSGITQGLGFKGMGTGREHPVSDGPLLRQIAMKRRRKGGPAGGRPYYNATGKQPYGGPAGGRPVR